MYRRILIRFVLILPSLVLNVTGAPLNAVRETMNIQIHDPQAAKPIVPFDAGTPRLPRSEENHSRKLITPLESLNVERRMAVDGSDAVDARLRDQQQQQYHRIQPVMMYKRDDPSFREEVLRRWVEKHYHIGVEY